MARSLSHASILLVPVMRCDIYIQLAQAAQQIVSQFREGAINCCLSSDQHNVEVGGLNVVNHGVDTSAQTAASAIAGDRIANFLAGCEADPNDRPQPSRQGHDHAPERPSPRTRVCVAPVERPKLTTPLHAGDAVI